MKRINLGGMEAISDVSVLVGSGGIGRVMLQASTEYEYGVQALGMYSVLRKIPVSHSYEKSDPMPAARIGCMAAREEKAMNKKRTTKGNKVRNFSGCP